ncbi:DegV family protein [Peptoniphilus sp.]|jgi:DegV family protein with EDD domain|uniref:DegV family protein n=1 Tax=Peptoniphilus sp. TaxID=1971214 RepID=UPI003D8DD8C5
MYKIITDTSCDLSKDEMQKLNISYVPFNIHVEEDEFIDDDNLDLNGLLEKMEKSHEPIMTSCPSPYDYLTIIEENLDKEIFILTISSALSGSFNSATVAANQAKEKHKDLKITVLDSKSASAGHTLVVLKLLELLKDNDFDEAEKKIRKIIDENTTMFVLESMQNLIKNGRIKKSTGLIANVLNIKPIMVSNNGEIDLYEINRGIRKSLDKMVGAIELISKKKTFDMITISYCKNKERAENLKEKIKELYDVDQVIVNHTNGISSSYADLGGIVIAF